MKRKTRPRPPASSRRYGARTEFFFVLFAMPASIKVKKDEFILRMRKRFGTSRPNGSRSQPKAPSKA